MEILATGVVFFFAFFAGDYVRQGFLLVSNEVVLKPVPAKILTDKEKKEQSTLVDQFNNMMSYSGKEQK